MTAEAPRPMPPEVARYLGSNDKNSPQTARGPSAPPPPKR